MKFIIFLSLRISSH